MPDFPRISGVSAAEVWEYHTRKLTGIDGQARIDLLGEDTDFESGVAPRKVRIDKIQNFLEEGNGTLTADGTEQTVREYTGTGKLHAYIDLSNMADGDAVTIRQFIKIKAGGTYRKYAEESYSGVQTLPLLHIISKPNKHGVKITLQQTAGTNRDYDWETFVEQTA
jgi:hypothetical protein